MSTRRFKLLWRALPRGGRREIILLAALGRRAPDPETAWFVTEFVGPRKPLQWIVVVVSVCMLALVAWIILHDGWSWRLLGVAPVVAFSVLTDLVLLGHR